MLTGLFADFPVATLDRQRLEMALTEMPNFSLVWEKELSLRSDNDFLISSVEIRETADLMY